MPANTSFLMKAALRISNTRTLVGFITAAGSSLCGDFGLPAFPLGAEGQVRVLGSRPCAA